MTFIITFLAVFQGDLLYAVGILNCLPFHNHVCGIGHMRNGITVPGSQALLYLMIAGDLISLIYQRTNNKANFSSLCFCASVFYLCNNHLSGNLPSGVVADTYTYTHGLYYYMIGTSWTYSSF